MVHGKETMVGFDCDGRTKNGVNITTFSLLAPKPCSLEKPVIQVNKVQIQLLESIEFQDINIFQCKIKVKRTVRRCSLFGYLEPVENGLQEYLLEISSTDCQQIHLTKTFFYDSTHIIHNLKVNDTTHRSIYLAGDAVDNSCNTASFSDQFGSWSKVNVEAVISITLNNYLAEVDVKKNKLVLRSGVVCEFDKMSCIDSEGGYTFWNPIQNIDCIIDKYFILYDGIVSRVYSRHFNSSQTIYSIDQYNMLFSFAELGRFNDCGELLIRTEEPKIFIRLYNDNMLRYRQSKIKKVDLLLYLNVKNIYMERHFREQMQDLHISVLEKRCETRTMQLQQVLDSTHLSPDLFALNLMKKTGFMAHFAGEVVHVVQCLPVEVEVADNLLECYEQLPVYINDKLKFLTPKTRILVKEGTQIKCNRLLPTQFQINGKWRTINPRIEDSAEPVSLIPDVGDSFILKKIVHIATAGIYSLKEMEDYLTRLLFPIEKQALLNDVVRSMVNEPVKNQLGLANLITDNVITSIAKKSWNLIWTDFMIFGQFSSGVMAVIYCAEIIVMLAELLIRGFILHRIFGFSFKLLGAVLNSLTHLFISMEKDKPSHQELQGITVIPRNKTVHSYSNPVFVEDCVRKESDYKGLIRVVESSF